MFTTVVLRVLIRLCQGLPDDMLSPAIIALRDEALDVLRGDWRSSTFEFYCSGDCNGNRERCRNNAIQKIRSVLVRLIFLHKIVIPALSRWWKAGPAARKVLLGTACFHVLGKVAPANWRDVRAQGNEDHDLGPIETWAAEHGFRVKATYLFFNNPDTIISLIVYLKVIGVHYRIMAWLMEHDSKIGAGDAADHDGILGSVFGQPALAPGQRVVESRIDAAVKFVTPAVSPIWESMAHGCHLLDEGLDDENWRALWHYSGGRSADGIQLIWSTLLPKLARLEVNVCLVVDAFHFKLFKLFSPDHQTRVSVSEEWEATRCPGCLGKSLEGLHESFPVAADCESPTFKAIVKEIIAQTDFSIFDVEIEHHLARDHLDRGMGNSAYLESASLAHMARDVSKQHDRAMAADKPVGTRGHRPRKEGFAQKRKFMSAFASFTEAARGMCDSRESLQQGEFGRSLSEEWNALPEEERERFRVLAQAEREAAKRAAPAEDGDEVVMSTASFWGIGSAHGPLRHEFAYRKNQRPDGSHDVISAETWCKDLHKPVEISSVIKDAYVTYEKLCSHVGVCKALYEPCWHHLMSFLERWRNLVKRVSSDVIENCQLAWLIRAAALPVPGADGEAPSTDMFAQAVLVAHRQKSPYSFVCLDLAMADVSSDLTQWAFALTLPQRLQLLVCRHRSSGRQQFVFQQDITIMAELARRHAASTFNSIDVIKLSFPLLGRGP